MTEISGIVAEQEKDPKLLELNKLIDSATPTSHNSIVFIPPIEGSKPLPPALTQFSEAGNDFWFTEFRKYGKTLEEYVTALQREIKEKISGNNITNNTIVIGYSSGCALAADLGISLHLPREDILLVAPVYPVKKFLGKRTGAVRQRIYDAIKGNSKLQPTGVGVDLDYVKRTFRLLKSRNPIRNYLNLRRLGTSTIQQIQSGTVFTGEQDDVISPKTDHTTVFVPKAGHNFEQMVPAITQHIASRAKG